MAFSLNDNGSRGRRTRGGQALSEINVTPFVDVVLVLLIIFMLTAHAMESGIEVDVPKTRSVATAQKDLPIVSVSKTGSVYLGQEAINIHLLPATVVKRFGSKQAIYVRADRETSWDALAQVVAELGAAKLNVTLVTQPTDSVGLSQSAARGQ